MPTATLTAHVDNTWSLPSREQLLIISARGHIISLRTLLVYPDPVRLLAGSTIEAQHSPRRHDVASEAAAAPQRFITSLLPTSPPVERC